MTYEKQKPLLEKLNLKPGCKAAILHLPEIDQDFLTVLPSGSSVVFDLEKGLDFILFFATKIMELESRLSDLKESMKQRGILWIAYPRSGAFGTDIYKDELSNTGKASGLQVVSDIVIDNIWSALRFKKI